MAGDGGGSRLSSHSLFANGVSARGPLVGGFAAGSQECNGGGGGLVPATELSIPPGGLLPIDRSEECTHNDIEKWISEYCISLHAFFLYIYIYVCASHTSNSGLEIVGFTQKIKEAEASASGRNIEGFASGFLASYRHVLP